MIKDRNAKTWDRGPPENAEIFTVEQLGPRREKTANGNLVCFDVPIARIGWMIYGPGETPIEVDPSTGYARVYRGEEELFSPTTIGSFMGVAVTDDHPEDDVNPKNWDKLSRGFSTTNVRRGVGEDSDCLLADLIVTHHDLIKQIEDGKREVSCGYSADYKQTHVGAGVQTNIIGNHIALTEKGRCGPRCAIGDSAPTFNQPEKEKVNMKRNKLHRLRAMVRDMESLVEETADPSLEGSDDDGENGTHIHIHTNGTSGQASEEPAGMPQRTPGQDEGGDDPVEQRFQALEQAIQQVAGTVGDLAGKIEQLMGGKGGEPAADPDPETPAKDTAEDLEEEDDESSKTSAKTGDSAALATSFQKLLADAEILVPGLRVPTFDAKASRKVTVDSMCSLRRKAVTAAMATRDGAALIEAAGGPKCDPDKLNCQQVASLFHAAVTSRRVLNNAGATRDAHRLPPNETKPTAGPVIKSVADINAQNKAFWASTSGGA
jgi:hypothetical protein